MTLQSTFNRLNAQHDAAVRGRFKMEWNLAVHAANAFINAGYQITVNDGEDDVLHMATDIGYILGAMFTTDEDRWKIYSNQEYVGWVKFIWGNSGWDAIHDYTTNLEHVMESVNEFSEKMAEA